MTNKTLLTVLLAFLCFLPAMADDVTYLTTEEFKARIFSQNYIDAIKF